MATSTSLSSTNVSVKKQSSRSKKSKNLGLDSSALERRSWEAWGQREESIFFDSLVRNSRNWGAIAADIGSKRSEQVRTYYYRILRKISRLLQAVHFNFDNRDRINTLIALLAYWEAKCETQHEESTIEFAEAIKDRILRQRQELDTMRSKRHPTPDKLTVQLVPSTEDVALSLLEANHNPKLQLTLKSKKSMASIVEHLTSKWVSPSGEPLHSTPLRLYVPEKLGHPGYGAESTETTILTVFHSMGCPTICKLEYNWNPDHSKLRMGMALPGHELQELHSTSDEGSDDLSDFSNQPPSPPSTASPSPRHHVSSNRLAVPDHNTLASGRAILADDALDDDAIRHHQLARLHASKVTIPATNPQGKSSQANQTSNSAPPSLKISLKNSKQSSASAPLNASSERPARYGTRSRRAAAVQERDNDIDDGILESGYDEYAQHPDRQHHIPQQQIRHPIMQDDLESHSSLSGLSSNLMQSSMIPSALVSDPYGADDNDLNGIDYSFGAFHDGSNYFVDNGRDEDSYASMAKGFGVIPPRIAPSQHTTVINTQHNHFYQNPASGPSWDAGQNLYGAPLDPYAYGYNHQAQSNPCYYGDMGGFYAPEYPSAYNQRTVQNPQASGYPQQGHPKSYK